MKSRFVLSLFIFLCFLFSCSIENSQYEKEKYIRSKNDLFFGGNHKLMSLNTYISKEVEGKISDSYFVVVGGISGNISENIDKKASFIWLNNKNEYIFSDLPLSKVRFQINDSIEYPYCKFKWTNNCISCMNESQDNILYVVLVLKNENIFGQSIKLDLN
ncbi:MAG: hypothetical protein M0Q13_11240 [Methanothrix sp.]|jgi:hypothetical protein|nr:hypothetical protein [Methanothrix sp.]